MPKLRERLRFDLADAFACHAELVADLLERVNTPILKAKTQPDNPLLAFAELTDRFGKGPAQALLSGDFGRRLGPRILDEVGQRAFGFLANRRIERERVL